MAMTKLKTDWVTVGRSGKTMDGREIKAEWLVDAAKNYSPVINGDGIYTAKIWPDHEKYVNYGYVAQLRVIDNSEGGKDLQAIIAPNENYIYEGRNSQKTSFSMELQPNFAGRGFYYLTGLAATDIPASLGTSELFFSRQDSKPDGLITGDFVANRIDLSQKETPNLLTMPLGQALAQLFTNKGDADMSKDNQQLLLQLKAELDETKAKLEAFTAGNQANTVTPEAFGELQAENAELKKEVEALKNSISEKDTAYTAISEVVTKLSARLDEALKEQPGTTPAGDNFSGDADTNIQLYI